MEKISNSPAGFCFSAAMGIGLSLFTLFTGPAPGLAQACGCSCAQPTVGYLASNGSCICPCATVITPALTVDTLTGPAGPAKQAVSWEAPDWGTDPDFDGFGWGGWGGWPGDFY
ncbi:MAG: hypothetical protein EBU30_08410 [Synechococcaceae bacterium WB6_3B_236]|jgi:hypothetical protein|nr:hypothetical protein [Synechococcaceae bacterium WB6_3B_236]